MAAHDAAPVPLPPMSPPIIARSVESLYGMTIPIHNAEPTKNTSSRQTKDLNAGGSTLRGFSVSAATIAIYSGPVILQIISKLTEDVQEELDACLRETCLIETREDT